MVNRVVEFLWIARVRHLLSRLQPHFWTIISTTLVKSTIMISYERKDKNCFENVLCASLIIFKPSRTMSVTGLSGLLGIVLSHLDTNSLRIIVSKLCTHNIGRNLAHFHNFFSSKIYTRLIRRQSWDRYLLFLKYIDRKRRKENLKRGGDEYFC